MRLAYLLLATLAALPAAAEESQYLDVQARIPLPGVQGRIDHLAFDARHNRLFVAALGNGSVEVVDVAARQVVRRITNLPEPQGVAYSDAAQRLYVACGGDGTLRSYRAADLAPAGAVKLGGDADNVRVDEHARRVYVGYGDGGLAVLNADSLELLAKIPLEAHPESFQLSPLDDRVFVNVPHARQIAVLSRNHARVVATWPTQGRQANYPMALTADGSAVFVVFRQPAGIAEYSTQDGHSTRATGTCIDADDVFVDTPRRRLYVICG